MVKKILKLPTPVVFNRGAAVAVPPGQPAAAVAVTTPPRQPAAAVAVTTPPRPGIRTPSPTTPEYQPTTPEFPPPQFNIPPAPQPRRQEQVFQSPFPAPLQEEKLPQYVITPDVEKIRQQLEEQKKYAVSPGKSLYQLPELEAYTGSPVKKEMELGNDGMDLQNVLFGMDDSENEEFHLDITQKWTRNIIRDLEYYPPEDLKIAIQTINGMFNENHPIGNQRDNIALIVQLVGQGYQIPILPPLDYLHHYVGENDEERLKNLESLTTSTLQTLLIRLGIENMQNVKSVNRQNAIARLNNWDYIVSYYEAMEWKKQNFMIFLKKRHIMISEKSKRSVSRMHEEYLDFLKQRGKVGLKKSNAPRSDVFRIKGIGRHVFISDPMNILSIVPSKDVTFTKKEIKEFFEELDSSPIKDYIDPAAKIYKRTEQWNKNYPDKVVPITTNFRLHYRYTDEKDTEIPFLSLISELSKNEIGELLFNLNIKSFKGSFADAIQILHLMYIYNIQQKTKEFERLAFCCSFSHDDLIMLIPKDFLKKYKNVITEEILGDYVSLIWTLTTWAQIPSIAPIANTMLYLGRCRLTYEIAYNIAKYLYNYDTSEQVFENETPWRFLSSRTPSILEPFIIRLYAQSPDLIASYKHFMIFPVSIRTDKEKKEYILNNLKLYERVFTRVFKPAPPGPEQIKTVKDATMFLEQFTDKELVETYKLTQRNWKSRSDLINQLALLNVSTTIEWFFTSNINRPPAANPPFDPIMQEDFDLNDETNPTIAYGNFYSYRIFTKNMLEYVFETKVDPETGEKIPRAKFSNPIWRPKPAHKAMEFKDEYYDDMEDFTFESIQQLEKLVQNAQNPLFDEFLIIIQQALREYVPVKGYILELSNKYNRLNEEGKRQFEWFVCKMLLLGMYTRFWKGPGFDYPHEWMENGLNTLKHLGPGDRERLVDQTVKDLNYTEKEAEIQNEIQKWGQDVQKMIREIHVFKYLWDTGTSGYTDEVLMKILGICRKGEFCTADISDRILETMYVLSSRVIKWSNEEMNRQLRSIMGNENQKDFVPSALQRSGHTEPTMRNRDIKFE